MKIRQLMTVNFQGLPGKKKISFPDKITAFCQKNGAGKTSVLNAIRFGLTGAEPEGDMINKKAADTTVAILGNHAYYRQRSRSSRSRFGIDNKNVTKRELETALEKECGVNMNAAMIVSSRDLLANMSPGQLGNFLMAYVGENLTRDTIKGSIPGITPGVSALIDQNFPEGLFGISQVDSVYSLLYDKRREIKKILSNQAAVMQSMNVTAKPEGDKSVLEQELASIGEKMMEAKQYTAKMQEYTTLLERENQRKKILAEIQQRIEEISRNSKDYAEEIARAQTNLEEKRNSITQTSQTITRLNVLLEELRKTADSLNTSICPISKKLICTTDKSVVQTDLEQEIAKTEAEVKTLQEAMQKAQKECDELAKELPVMQQATLNWKNLLTLREKEKNFQEMKITVPEKPVAVNADELMQKDKRIREQLVALAKYEDFMKLKGQHDQGTALLNNMSLLIDALAKNGSVKTEIIRGYMQTFSDMCNQKAAAYGSKVLFVSDGGVKVMMSPDGSGDKYLSFKALSGGEQAMLIFFMMDMLASLSGLKILFLDELSVLDSHSMDVLLKLITDNQENYDHVFLACVDHEDTKQCLQKHGISITEI